MAAATTAYVAPSGQSLFFRFADDAQSPPADSFVTSVVDNNEVQSVTINARPSGGTFALTFNGQTTAAIPTIPSPPAAYFQWNKTDLTPGTYDLAVNVFIGGFGAPNTVYEIFDGAIGETPLATFTLNLSFSSGNGGPTNAPTFTDGTLLRNDGVTPGGPVQWHPLGRYTFATSSMHVRVSCPATQAEGRTYLNADNLRIATTDGATVVRLQTTAPPATFAAGPNYQADPQPFQVFGDTSNLVFMQGLGVGVRYLADPAVVQSALQALSNVGSGNLAVTGDGSALSPFQLKFGGSLSDSDQPSVTCGDPAIATATIHPGGILPVIRVNGGPEVRLKSTWKYWHDTVHVMPTVEFFLPQAPDDVVDINVGAYLGSYANATGGYWDYAFVAGFGPYGPLATNGDGSGLTATWKYAPLRASTIRVSGIWPGGPGLSTSVTYTVKDLSGTVLGTHTIDQTAAPSGTPDGHGHTFEVFGSFAVPDGDGLIVVQSNGTSARMIADTLRFERTSPDDSIRISSGDVVTARWGAGWATCQAGQAPEETGTTLANKVGGTLYPPLPTSVSMKIGWNLGFIDGAQSYLMYQNVAKQGYYYGGPFTSYPSPSATIPFTFAPTSLDSNNLSWPSLPNGPWTMLWDGASVLVPTTSGNGNVTIDSTAPGRVDFTTSGGWSSYGAALAVTIHASAGSSAPYTYDFTNLRILPGGSDLENPPTFRADFLDVISHGHSVRHLNTLQVDLGNCAIFSDFNNPAPNKVQVARIERPGFARIEWFGGADLGFTGTGRVQGVLLKVTAPAPHNLSNGQFVTFSYSGPDLILETDTPTGAWPASITRNLAGHSGFVWALDATRYVVYPTIQLPVGYRMTNVLVDPSPGGYLEMNVLGTMPCADICELANLTNTSPCIPVTYSATDAALDALGAFYATHLNPGIKLRVQVSNEAWNFTNYDQFAYSSVSSILFYNATDSYFVYYAERAQQVWVRFKAAFVGAGGDPADFVRVLDGQMGDGSKTTSLATYMHGRGYTCDEFSVAPYFENSPALTLGGLGAVSGSFPSLVDSLTVGQHLDMLGIHWTYGSLEDEFPPHRAALVGLQPDSSMLYPEFADVPLISYEGGQEHMNLLGGSGINQARKSHAIVRSPECYGLQTHRFRVSQDSGCTLFQVFQVSGGDSTDGTAWANYQYTGQTPYSPGNPIQDAIQRDTPDQLPLVHSVSGGAVRDWFTMHDAVTVPDFSVALTGPGTVAQGGTITLTITMTALDGYTGTATPAITMGLTAGLTQVGPFSPTSLVGGGTMVATVALHAASSAATGPTTIVVAATDAGNSLMHAGTLMLTVTGTGGGPTIAAVAARHVQQFRHVAVN